MGVITYTHDVNGSIQQAQGSDNRLNVSSRGDSRSYYNSRDNQEAYSLVWEDASSEDGDIVLYWKNTDSQGRHLVIDSAGMNSAETADFQLLIVSGTAAGGTTAVPVCLNRAAPRVAPSTSLTAVTAPITGLNEDLIVDHAGCVAGGHEEFRLDDRLRIGEGGALAIKMNSTPATPTRTWGVVFGYFE